MEKEMTRKLEEAFREIEQLRQENARLRKKLGIEVSEPRADYHQSGQTSMGFNTKLAEAQQTIHSERSEPTSVESPRVRSNFSAEEKIRLFRTLFRGREDVDAVFWFNERTGKKGY